MNINWRKKITGGLLLSSLALSLSAVAFAAEPPNSTAGPKQNGIYAGNPRPEDPAQRLRSTLNKLVEKKVIEADQSHRVILFFQQKDAERKAEWDKIQGLSAEEREAYMQQQCIQRCQKRPDLVKDLMEGAGLTQEQAKAIAGEMRPPHGPGPDGPGGFGGPGPKTQNLPTP